jgi:energy-coupling factor transporter ATP-binding protein EcfA2
MLFFDAYLSAIGALLPVLVLAILLALLVSFGPRAITAWRQRAYDSETASEIVRLELIPRGGGEIGPQRPLALIRALHSERRRGTSRWSLGWPSAELRVVWRDGRLLWQVDCRRQVVPSLEATLRPLYAGLDLRLVERNDSPAAATAVGSLTLESYWPLAEADLPENRALHRLAGALETLPSELQARLRLTARPMSPNDWRKLLTPPTEKSESIPSIIGQALIDAVFNRSSSDQPTTRQPVVLSVEEREAYAGKRRGEMGFQVGMRLELAGTSGEEATAELWRLIEFTQPLTSGAQRLHWQPGPGAPAKVPSAKLADFELAQLWYLPDASFDQLELPRERPLVAPPPARIATAREAVAVATTPNGPLRLGLDQLAEHVAVIGATGAGKSTLLLSLALGLLDTPAGATIIDPHGDLAADLLSRVPTKHAGRVHVLRLADKAHPRGFNFLERRGPDEAQLVTSEFVELFEDLWPKFCGPKMQHYLRQGLLTLLAHPEPQTIVELVRLLTDDDFREDYIDHVDDAMLSAFWRNEWPGPRERDRDTSIKAVLHKLGAFVSYGSIRHVVGQGLSTLRPREVMDAGDLLVVDLSRVGGDNAQLFGAMIISRFYVDAIGRQGTDAATRRPHMLIIDEAQRFSTRAVERISVEGRKFGLQLCLATQSLASLPPRLRSAIVTNVATMALLRPGADDLRDLARLFDMVPIEELYRLRRFEVVVRALDASGRPRAYGGMVDRLPPGDPHAAEAIILASNARDARPLQAVRDEVGRRAGHVEPPQPASSPPDVNGRRRRRRRHQARGPLRA